MIKRTRICKECGLSWHPYVHHKFVSIEKQTFLDEYNIKNPLE